MLAVAVWASLADTPAYAAEVALAERVAGRAAADVLRATFPFGEVARLGKLCAHAGVPAAHIELRRGRGRFPSIRVMVEADVRGWLPLMGVVFGEDLIGEILRQAQSALQPFVARDAGGVTFASPALLATATKSPSSA